MKILATLLFAVVACAARAYNWIYNPDTGHYYAAIHLDQGISWQDARNIATNLGGHLASIGSQQENEFVFSLIDFDYYWYQPRFTQNILGPWIGGFQPPDSIEPDGGWCWDDGSLFGYTNWASGEPNNSSGIEDAIHYLGSGDERLSTWNDYPQNGNVPGEQFLPYGFVIETVPEPATVAGIALGIAFLTRRKK